LTLPRFRTNNSRNFRLSGESREKGESSNLPTTPVPHTVQFSCVTTRGDEQLGQDWGISGILFSNKRSLAKILGFVNIFGKNSNNLVLVQLICILSLRALS
jgi:hypothetical protein